MYQYSALKGAILERYGTQYAFAKALGMGYATLNLKLNNKSEWSQEEMRTALQLLGKDISDIEKFFYQKSLEN